MMRSEQELSIENWIKMNQAIRMAHRDEAMESFRGLLEKSYPPKPLGIFHRNESKTIQT
jgi:hypothetical protein